MSNSDLHTGRRDRLRRRYLLEGLDYFEPHEVLELILYYTIPRADTNAIAHDLLKTFGSLSAVMEAPMEALAAVDGMGPVSALYLKLFSDVCRKYEIDSIHSATQDKPLETPEQVSACFYPYYIGRKQEMLYLLCLDNRSRNLGIFHISTGSINRASVDFRKITSVVLQCNASGVFLCHNHPGGLALPSQDDIDVTNATRDHLQNLDVTLIDHVIIAGNEALFLLHGHSQEIPTPT